MPFKIVHNDITKMQTDAIVNTANEAPVYSLGTDAAIYRAAGEEKLLEARRKIGFLKEGDVAVTPGFALPAKYIFHAVSPLYVDGTHGEEEKLKACYEKSLHLAKKKRCKSIAFPLIATGNFGYPKEEGMEIALQAIHRFLMKEDLMVYLVVFDPESVRLSGQLFDEIESYVDAHYVKQLQKWEYEDVLAEDDRSEPHSNRPGPSILREASMPYRAREVSMPTMPKESSRAAMSSLKERKQSSGMRSLSLEDLEKRVGETFQQRLFRLIDERNRGDVEVYKKACKDKKFFHKIKKNVQYQPTKHTVFAFALALELNLDETKDLLASAGFAFSPSSRFDLILQYVIEHGIYDLYKIDCILYDMGETHFFACEN